MSYAPDPDRARWIDAARARAVGECAALLNLPLKGRGRGDRTGPCPVCGGVDRFAVNERKNAWNCRGCGKGGHDGLGLVMHARQAGFLEAVEWLAGPPPARAHAGDDENARMAWRAEMDRLAAEAADERQRREDENELYREKARRDAFSRWQSAREALGSPVETYLAGRGIELRRMPPVLRFLPDQPYFHGDRTVIHNGPAMAAAIQRPDGRFGALHVTWIDPARHDRKATIIDPATGEILPSKKSFGAKKGGAIRLIPARAGSTLLVLGEGIETTFSAAQALMRRGAAAWRDAAFWAGVDLGNIAGKAVDSVPHPTRKHANGHVAMVPGGEPAPDDDCLPPPEGVEETFFLGDGDSDPFDTLNALTRACRRWSRAGRRCRMAFAADGFDFNNMLKGEG